MNVLQSGVSMQSEENVITIVDVEEQKHILCIEPCNTAVFHGEVFLNENFYQIATVPVNIDFLWYAALKRVGLAVNKTDTYIDLWTGQTIIIDF